MKRIILFIFLLSCINQLSAQTISDGNMMPKNDLCTGFMYGYDRWTNYWEGTLKRDNGNIGTITTQSLSWVGVYGIVNRVNAIVMIPYVWTKASQGTLHGMEGLQDISISAKYNFLNHQFGENKFRAIGVLSFTTPLTNYSPDFLPMSIGLGSTNLSWRLSANYHMNSGLFFNGSGAYTWRSNVNLDRSSYYTDGQLYPTDEVKMPDVFDFIFSAGYKKGAISAELNYCKQNTLGGGDIRRQDMPFVSNQMDFSKIGALIIYDVPKPKNFVLRGGINYTLTGRDVGKSTTLMAGLLYTFHFSKINKSENL